MYSGKTEELIRRLVRSQIAQQRVKIFKPLVDDRFGVHKVTSHRQSSIPCQPVHHAREILELAGDSEVIGIDEAQFFDASLVEVSQQLANRNIRVILAGLDMDFEAKPFGPIPALLAIAEFVTKTRAICHQCGGTASYSYRISKEAGQILVGKQESYEARCRRCYFQKETPA